VGRARPPQTRQIQDLFLRDVTLTLDTMSLLTLPSRVRRPRHSTTRLAAAVASHNPLPPPVQARVQLSADLVSALLEVEGRQRPTLDDLEWADALAARMATRQAQRVANDLLYCASTATTPRRRPTTAF
jgi:hypothetical protein